MVTYIEHISYLVELPVGGPLLVELFLKGFLFPQVLSECRELGANAELDN
jgi:hypothetical protein